jgi:hypothetical protein
MFQDLQKEIASAVSDHVPVDDVYCRLIEPASLRASQRAELWLYAWSVEQRCGDARSHRHRSGYLP